MATSQVIAFGVDVTPSTVRFMLVMMVLILAGRGIYDIRRVFSGAPKRPPASVLEALTRRGKTAPAAGYILGLLVILFLFWLDRHLQHMCATDPGAHTFWGDCTK